MEKDIDYTERIRNFMALIENDNEEIAFNYLSKTNWDEAKAVNLYNSECRPKYSNYTYSKDLEAEIKENLIIPSTNQPNQTQTEEAPQGLFSRYIISPLIEFVTGMCSEKREVKEDEEDRLFKPLPERVKSFSTWSSLIKQKLGIMILYTGKDVNAIFNLVNEIISNSNKDTYDAIKFNCVVFSVLVSCNEGTRIASLISDELLTPCILFSFNTGNNSTFNRSSVIHTLEGIITFELFNQALFTAIEKKINLVEHPPLTNAQIIEQQKRDLKELEKQELIRKIEEENMLKEEKRLIEENTKKQKEKESKIDQIKKKIPSEPPKDDNTSLIIFRYPDGNRRIERRFYKSDRIELLYDFIESLGDDIYTEPENEFFELIQSIPLKKFNQKNKTLEEENLFPNAVIQIKEL